MTNHCSECGVPLDSEDGYEDETVPICMDCKLEALRDSEPSQELDFED